MNTDSAKGWVLGSWIVMMGLISIKSIAKEAPEFPKPGSYLGASVVFTMLYGLASIAGSLGAVLAVGTVVAAAAAPYMKGQPGILDVSAQWLSKINGEQ